MFHSLLGSKMHHADCCQVHRVRGPDGLLNPVRLPWRHLSADTLTTVRELEDCRLPLATASDFRTEITPPFQAGYSIRRLPVPISLNEFRISGLALRMPFVTYRICLRSHRPRPAVSGCLRSGALYPSRKGPAARHMPYRLDLAAETPAFRSRENE